MSLSPEAREANEYRWINHAANLLDLGTRAIWYSFRSSARHFASPHKTHVVWCLNDNAQPEVLDTLRLTDVDVDLQHGLCLTFIRRDDTHFIVTPQPSKLPGLDVFFWVPGLADVRWTPNDWARADAPRELRVSFATKVRRKISGGYISGPHYIHDLKDFVRLYPQMKNNV